MGNKIYCVFLFDIYYTPEQLAAAGIDDTAFRICSEIEPFDWDGNTYAAGGHILKLSPVPVSKDPTNKRLTLTISGVPEEAQRLYSQDAGVVSYRLRVLTSADGGNTYTVRAGGLRGRCGAPVYRGSTIEIPLETRDADLSLAAPVTWSDEAQQTRHPGDKGLEFVRELANSFNTSWA